jgi:hypothetical protein
MFILGGTNPLLSRYNLCSAGSPSVLRLNSMPTIKKYLRWAVLGLIFVLTASVNMFCVVIDNDGDGDPTTGLTIEFTVVPGKRIQVVANPVHQKSTLASKVFRAGFFYKQRTERSDDVSTNSSFSNLVNVLGSPLRC